MACSTFAVAISIAIFVFVPLVGAADSADATSVRSLSCGPACLSVAARLAGRDLKPSELERALRASSIDPGGPCTLEQIKEAAEGLGLATLPAQLAPADPGLARLPLIARVRLGPAKDDGHFVILYGRVNDRVQVLDYPNPPLLVPVGELRRGWEGVGLYIACEPRELSGISDSRDFSRP